MADTHPGGRTAAGARGGTLGGMMPLRRSAWRVAPVIAAAVVVASCSSSGSTSAVCDQADQVRVTVQHLKDIQLSENGMVALTSGLTQLRDQINQLKSVAADQYGPEITGVQTAIDDLATKAQAARNDPTAASLSAVGTSVAAAQTAMQSLASSVGNC